MPTARYRVTINGFTCSRQTWDDALNWDGKADEVFISTSVKYANKDGQILFEHQASTPIMGDTWNNANRIQAGKASERGGIITGDEFPNQRPTWPDLLGPSFGPWERKIPLSSGRNYPPMTVWEGDLTQGEEVVFVTPTIWEWDPGQSLFEGWVRWHQEIDAKFGEKAKEIVSKVWPAAEFAFPMTSLAINTIGTLFDVTGPLGSPGSRPIGMKADKADPTGKTFSVTPHTVALNYNMAELYTSQNPNGLGNGIIPLQYADHEYFKGDYTIYLQVERVNVVEPTVPNTSPGGGGRYEGLGGNLTSAPGVCSMDVNRLDVFTRGVDGALWHLQYAGGWTAWEQLGANGILSNPAAVSWGPNRIDVFVRGTDNALYTKSWDGNHWTDYVGLQGGLTSGPAACSWAEGRLDVFARGTDNALWHRGYDGGWHPWEQLGVNQIASDPSAVSWGPNRIDVFVRGTDNALYTKSWDGNHWTDYVGLGGSLTSGPAACSWAPGRLDVFARGTDNALWHLPYEGHWRNWEQLSANPIASSPGAVSWGANRIDVFVRGTDNALYHKWWNGIWNPANP